MWDDKEVNLYRKEWYSLYRVTPMSDDLKFSCPKAEYQLTRVRLASKQPKCRITAYLWVVSGHFFSFQFSQSPKKLGTDFEITEAELLQDPMSIELQAPPFIEAKLPPDYLELLKSGNRNINGWKIFDVADIRSVVGQDANLHMLAEKDTVGALALKDEDESGELYFFDYNDDEERAVGKLLKFACETLL